MIFWETMHPILGDAPPDNALETLEAEDSSSGGADEGSDGEGDGDVVKPEYYFFVGGVGVQYSLDHWLRISFDTANNYLGWVTIT